MKIEFEGTIGSIKKEMAAFLGGVEPHIRPSATKEAKGWESEVAAAAEKIVEKALPVTEKTPATTLKNSLRRSPVVEEVEDWPEEQPKKASTKKAPAKEKGDSVKQLKAEIDKRIEELDADGRMNFVEELFQKQYCQPLRDISPDLYSEVIERLEAIKYYHLPESTENEKVTPTITLSDLTRRAKDANNNAKVRKLLNKFGAINPETNRPGLSCLKEQDYALFLAELEA